MGTERDRYEITDDEWLAVLAGRARPGPGRDAQLAQTLRHTILAEFEDSVETQIPASGSSPQAGGRPPARTPRGAPVAAAAILLVALAGTVIYLQYPNDPAPVPRGGAFVETVIVESPRELGIALRDSVLAAGGEASLTRERGNWILRAERPPGGAPRLEQQLETLGLSWDADGRLEARLRSPDPDK